MNVSSDACAAYGRSAEKVPLRDIRHLLRHLDDPRALATNPFCRALPPGMRDRARVVRGAVDEAIAAFTDRPGTIASRERNRRAQVILTRCDLEAAEHDDVAAQLGLSRRQFYRDRRFALETLAFELQSRLRSRAHVPAVSTDVQTLAFESAAALVAVGKFDDAYRTLQRIAHTGGERSLRAHCELVEIAVEAGNGPRAQANLGAARCAEVHVAERITSATSARLDLAEALVRRLHGDHAAANTLRTRAIAALRGDARSDPTQRTEALCRALIADADALRSAGEYRAALDRLEEAKNLVDPLESAPAVLLATLLNELGATWVLARNGLARASEMNRKAIAYARDRGLMRIAFATMINECAIDYWRGHPANALATARIALDAARYSVFPDEFARMALLASTFALASGKTDVALSLVREARTVASESAVVKSRAMLAEAHMLLRSGSYEPAVARAMDAAREMEGGGVQVLLGTAYLYAAEGQAAIGRRQEATSTLRDAIDRLERSGSPYTLLLAYRFSANLTGAQNHSRLARELSQTFASAP